MSDLQPELQPKADDEPCGDIGGETERDERGRFRSGNKAAIVVGEHSQAFWAGVEARRREIEDALIADAGHARDDAPQALRLVVAGIAEAALLKTSAFERIVASGGPLTSDGRARRAYQVWLSASERLHRGLQLVGLSRRARPLTSLTEAVMAQPVRGRSDED